MEDQEKQCVDCPNSFTITASEQKFYEGKGLSLPKRCKNCRILKRQKKEAEGRE